MGSGRCPESRAAARAVLGHRTPAVTEVYAELDASKAEAVIQKTG
jgi:hypothetical protein